MRFFLIRVLLRLLSIPIAKINEKRIRIFLWTVLPQQGFQDYITWRDKELLQHLGQGVDREEYLITLGQRIELGLILQEAKKAYQRVERERKEKVEAIKNTSKDKKIIKENGI